jgi:hypothetical protein
MVKLGPERNAQVYVVRRRACSVRFRCALQHSRQPQRSASYVSSATHLNASAFVAPFPSPFSFLLIYEERRM